jgi:hypothetical protein
LLSWNQKLNKIPELGENGANWEKASRKVALRPTSRKPCHNQKTNQIAGLGILAELAERPTLFAQFMFLG